MDQAGKVVAVEEGYADILLLRNRACDKCGICHMGETKDLRLRLENTIDAEVGQRVLIQLESPAFLKAGFIVFLIPLTLLLVGMGISSLLFRYLEISGDIQLWSVGVGLLFFAGGFVVIRSMESRWQRNAQYTPVLVRVLDEYEDIESSCGTDNE